MSVIPVSRRSFVTTISGLVLAGAIIGTSVPANAAVPVITAAEQPVQAITSPQQVATQQYAKDVALSILADSAKPQPGDMVDLNDVHVRNLVEAKNAGAKPINGVTSRVGNIAYAQTTYKSGLVMANLSSGQETQTISLTGGSYTLPGNSGQHGWVPKGGIGSKWKGLGGASVVGLPSTPEVLGYNGVHAGAIQVVSQEFVKGGSVSDIQWTSQYGSHQIKGAIRGAYEANGGKRTQGAAKTDEYRYGTGVRQDFERASYVWTPESGTKRVA